MTAANSGSLTIGLDIGGTKVHGVVVDADGVIRAEARDRTTRGAEGVVASAATVVDELREALGRPVGEPIDSVVGVGIPGIVDAGQGTVAYALNLGLTEPVPLARLLGERLGMPVVVENDLNAVTLGAQTLSGADDFVYLSIGTGLAAGFVLDGTLRRGVAGAAGEIGHIPVDPAGEPCHCGQRGCLELVASGSAIAKAWPSEGTPPPKALFDAADAGDAKAIAVRDRFIAGVADAIRIATLAVDPGTIILGGGITQLGERLLSAVTASLRASESRSQFLASLRLADRVRLVPADVPVAALGAAIVGRRLVSGS